MRALIFGVTGQDGAYLARHLLERGHCVIGATRDAQARHANLDRLQLRDRLSLRTCSARDLSSTLALIEQCQPDLVFNLSGQTSVGRSFEQPIETHSSIIDAVSNMLEAIRLCRAPIRFYNASSSEMFGNTPLAGAHERTPLDPKSPYGEAKAAAHFAVRRYRDAYGLFACSGILFNHESSLRGENFVTRKVILSAASIARKETKQLHLGDIGIWRDWGWAPEFVEAMAAIALAEEPADYVIATGMASKLEQFVALAFDFHGLDWREHTVLDGSLRRPSEIEFSVGDASLAEAKLTWRASVSLPEVVRRLSLEHQGETIL